MSIERLRGYQQMKGPKGESSDARNLDYWARRAEANSQLAPRASNGPMKLPSTGKRVETRDTAMQPKISRNAEGAMKAAKADKNDVGSSFMPNVRRTGN